MKDCLALCLARLTPKITCHSSSIRRRYFIMPDRLSLSAYSSSPKVSTARAPESSGISALSGVFTMDFNGGSCSWNRMNDTKDSENGAPAVPVRAEASASSSKCSRCMTIRLAISRVRGDTTFF